MSNLYEAEELINIFNTQEEEFSTGESIKYAIQGAVTSAAVQLKDIPTSVGNMFGGDEELTDIEGVIYDTFGADAAAYYSQNKQGVDAAGFIASSLVPGTLGIKGLNAGQKALRAGIAGKELHPFYKNAVGVVAPNYQAAIANVKVSSAINNRASMLRSESLKAFAKGTHQTVLDAMAFELAVTATMAEGEVLGDLSTKELLTNMATGVAITAPIGAVFSAMAVKGASKAGLGEHQELFNTLSIPSRLPDNIDEATKAAVYLKELGTLRQEYTYERIWEEVSKSKLPLEPDAQGKLLTALTNARTKTENTYENWARESFMTIAKGDRYVAETLLENAKKLTPEQLSDDLLGLSEAIPAGAYSKVQAAERKQMRALKTKLELPETNYKVIYADFVENKFNKDAPSYLSLQDLGKEIKFKKDSLQVGKDTYKIQTKLELDTKPDLLTIRENEARSIWMSQQDNKYFTKAESVALDDIGAMDTIMHRLLTGKLKGTDFKDSKFVVRTTDDAGNIQKQVFDLRTQLDELKDLHFKNKAEWSHKIWVNRRDLPVQGAVARAKAEELSKISGIALEVRTPDELAAMGSSRTANATYSAANKKIYVNSEALNRRSLKQNLQTVLHEYGHARDLRGRASVKVKSKEAIDEAVKLSKIARPEHWASAKAIEASMKKGKTVSQEEKDFVTYMNQKEELIADARAMLAVMPESEIAKYPNLANELGFSLHRVNENLQRLFGYNVEGDISLEALSRALNMHPDALVAISSGNAHKVLGDANALLYRELRAEVAAAKTPVAPHEIPYYHKVTYDSSLVKMDENEARGFAKIIGNVKAFEAQSGAVADGVLGKDLAKTLPTTEVVNRALISTVDTTGTGSGWLTASNKDYGTLGSYTKYIGAVVNRAKNVINTEMVNTFETVTNRLLGNPALARSYGILDNQLRRRPYQYVLDKDANKMVVKEVAEYNKVVQKVTDVGGDPSTIKKPEILKDPALADMVEVDLVKLAPKGAVNDLVNIIETHIKTNGKTLNDRAVIDNIKNGSVSRFASLTDVYYPLPPDTKNKPFVAYVFDNSIKNGKQHSTMLYARSERELEDYIARVESHPDFGGTVKVRRPSEVKEYYQSIGEFDSSKMFDSIALRSELQRRGLDAPFEAITDGKALAESLVNFHASARKANISRAVELKYAGAFNTLKKAAESHSATPLKGSFIKKDINPYQTYINEMLDISSASQYTAWHKAGETVESLFTTVHNEVYANFRAGSQVTMDDLLEANKVLKENGFQGAFVEPMTMELANRQVKQHTASKFVSAINGLTSFFVLRTDPLHAINNLIGHNVLYQAELRDVLKRIEMADPSSPLLANMKLKTPDGKGGFTLSQAKIVKQALNDYWQRQDLREQYKSVGFHMEVTEQVRALLDDVAIDVGKETTESVASKTAKLESKLKDLGGLLERKTLNAFSEEMTNFISARTAHIIAEEAVRVGAMDASSVFAFVNTFTNRVRGTYVASQRPAMFQGPIGMSMALFQTYQLNLLQQLFRYGSEGRMKTGAVMMGLQASLYGAASVPGYHAVNSYVANMEGNTDRSDITGTVYKAFNTDGADWVMYGLASNFTTLLGGEGINLFTRGDLNPREITVIPINPLDAPLFSGWTKFLGNLADSGSKLANGADAYTTITRALEHNGLSRPLSGIGKTLQGLATDELTPYSTDRSGKLLESHDLFSLATIMNVAGGKTLTEARSLDALYRMKAYEADRRGDMAELKTLIRYHAVNESRLEPEDYRYFMEKYAAKGGDITRFRQFVMDAIKEANESTLEVIAGENRSAYGKDFQAIIGGNLRDLYPE